MTTDEGDEAYHIGNSDGGRQYGLPQWLIV